LPGLRPAKGSLRSYLTDRLQAAFATGMRFRVDWTKEHRHGMAVVHGPDSRQTSTANTGLGGTMAGDHSSQESADRGHWFVLKDGQELGPISTKELAGYLADGLVAGSDLVRRTGQDWMPADKIGQVGPELPAIKNRAIAAAEPAPAKPAPRPPLFAFAPSLFGSLKTSAETSERLVLGPATQVQKSTSPPKHSVHADALRVRDYALRHWHGELSLPVSCLINGLLLAWPFALVAWLSFTSVAQASILPFGLAYIFAVLVPLAVLAAWEIGLWRSADKFAAGGGDLRWAMLARAMVVVAIGAWAYDAWTRDWQTAENPTNPEPKIQEAKFQQDKQANIPGVGPQGTSAQPHTQETSIAPAKPHESKAKEIATAKSREASATVQAVEGGALASGDHAGNAFRTHRRGMELELTGVIGPDAATEFKRVLDDSPQVKLVRLNSPGGDFSEAKQIGAEIKRRGLTTMVSQSCTSACVVVFLNGRERSIGRNGKLTFNAPPPAGSGKGQAATVQAGEKQALLDTGLPLGFIDKAMGATSPFVPSREELISAGIITDASDHQLHAEHRLHHTRSAARHHRSLYHTFGRDD